MTRLLSLTVAASITTAGSAFLARANPSAVPFSGATRVSAALLAAAPIFARGVSSTTDGTSSCNATNLDADAGAVPPPLSDMYDREYPGTAVSRMRAIRARVAELASSEDKPFDGPWEDVRRRILWAGGLRDLPNARPGQGYTGHSFNDWNHVDLTAMTDGESDNLHEGQVKGIAIGNRLGPGIKIASLPELGPGGSWSTCAMGCNSDPPRDVAHVQFRSRVAFKLVWVPNDHYDSFVLVDDDGNLLARGKPSGSLPPLFERKKNYSIMEGSKYAREADRIAASNATAED